MCLPAHAHASSWRLLPLVLLLFARTAFQKEQTLTGLRVPAYFPGFFAKLCCSSLASAGRCKPREAESAAAGSAVSFPYLEAIELAFLIHHKLGKLRLSFVRAQQPICQRPVDLQRNLPATWPIKPINGSISFPFFSKV